MKNIKWTEIIALLIGLVRIWRKIVAVNNISVSNYDKHQAVKAMIMPYVKKKGWDFTGDDVDRIINELVWVIKKIIRSKPPANKSRGYYNGLDAAGGK